MPVARMLMSRIQATTRQARRRGSRTRSSRRAQGESWLRSWMRIVSLLPSTTEILFAIGAGAKVLGVTFECDYPPDARSRQVVSLPTMQTGLSPAEIDAVVRERMAAGEELYRLDRDALRQIDPDLVITQDLCAVCAVDVNTVDAAMDFLGCDGRVLTIDPSTLDEVLASIATIGAATDIGESAERVVAALQARLDRVAAEIADLPRPRVAVLEWTDPPFNAGHWVPDMVAAAGGISVLGTSGSRSTQISWQDVSEAAPEVIVVAPCGYHLADARRLAAKVVAAGVLPSGVPVWAVDADSAFVRPGPRLVDGVEALAAICHPDRFGPRPDLVAYVD